MQQDLCAGLLSPVLVTFSNYELWFAQVWLDRERFLTGSKDNRLMMWKVGEVGETVVCEQIALPASVRPDPAERGGIHALSMSPNATLLAVGSSNPCEVAVLETESWKCRTVCVGHGDWVFGAEWIDDDTLWTCSRDKTVKIWRIAADDASSVIAPGTTLKHHADRVRAMKKIQRLGQVRDVLTSSSPFVTEMLCFFKVATLGENNI
jgi:WD40 repeat protein